LPVFLGYECADGAYKGSTIGTVDFITTNPNNAGLINLRAEIKSKAALGHIPVLHFHARSPDPTAGTNYSQAAPIDWAELSTVGSVTWTRWIIFISSQLDFLATLEFDNGDPIECILRWLHESTGGGFWWVPWSSVPTLHPGANAGLGLAADPSRPLRLTNMKRFMTDMVKLRHGSRQWIPVHATGGTMTISFNGQTTAAIAYNASAGTMQTALEALSNVAPGDVVVTKSASNNCFIFNFAGAYASGSVPAMTVDITNLTGGPTTAPRASAHYTRGFNNFLISEHWHSHDPYGWNRGLASSLYGTNVTGWDVIDPSYDGQNYVDLYTFSRYGDWDADTMRRAIYMYEMVCNGKPLMALEIGPSGGSGAQTPWNFATLMDRINTPYVGSQINFSTKSGTTGLHGVVLGASHWGGTWSFTSTSNGTWVAAMQDNDSLLLSDFKLLAGI